MSRIRFYSSNNFSSKGVKGYFLLNTGKFIKPEIGYQFKELIVGYVVDVRDGQTRVCAINASSDKYTWGRYNQSTLGWLNTENYNGATGNQSWKHSDAMNLTPTSGALSRLDGKDNSNLQSQYKSELSALNYCLSYSPGYKDGEWYLPAQGELFLWYKERVTFRSVVTNAGLSTNMNKDGNNAYQFWSSSQYSSNRAWYLYVKSTDLGSNWNIKVNFNLFSRYVLPFLLL